jgi:hypothetical protein
MSFLTGYSSSLTKEWLPSLLIESLSHLQETLSILLKTAEERDSKGYVLALGVFPTAVNETLAPSFTKPVGYSYSALYQ